MDEDKEKKKEGKDENKPNNEDEEGITWSAGTGRGRVRVEQVKKTDDAIRPIVLEGVEAIDRMDLFRSVGSMVGRISLEFDVFKQMQVQYGRVVLWLDSKRLSEFLPDRVWSPSFKVSAEREVERPQHFTLQRLSTVDGLKISGAMVPNASYVPKQAKQDVTVPIGIFLKQGGSVGTVFSVLTPARTPALQSVYICIFLGVWLLPVQPHAP